MSKEMIYDASLKKWGKEKQMIVAIEELSELIQAISKMLRAKEMPKISENMIEEIADCIIMLEQLQRMFDVRIKVIEQYNAKLKRLEQIVCETTRKAD